MSNFKNTVQLVGNLGSDPEIRQTSSGKKVGRVSLATNDNYTDKNGERKKRTEWHNLVAWDGRADYMEKYLHKGSYVGVQGRIAHRTYEGKDGNKKHYTEVIVKEFLNLSGKEQQA